MIKVVKIFIYAITFEIHVTDEFFFPILVSYSYQTDVDDAGSWFYELRTNQITHAWNDQVTEKYTLECRNLYQSL